MDEQLNEVPVVGGGAELQDGFSVAVCQCGGRGEGHGDIATFARSFKEAQSYLGMLIVLPMLPGMLSMLYPLGNQPWMIPIPILGQHVLLADVLGGKTPELIWFGVAGLSALVAGLVCVYLTTRLFHKEKIIFGG